MKRPDIVEHAIQRADPVQRSSLDSVKYVENKVCKKDVAPGFTPVMIFRLESLHNGNVNPVAAACGTAFVGRNGEWKVTSAGHVFSKQNKGSYFYLFRLLRPYEKDPTRGASSAVQIYDDNYDVVECTVGKPEKIAGISAYGGDFSGNREWKGDYRPIEGAGIINFKSFELTSIVSGEHAKIFLVSTKNYGNTFQWVIGYTGIIGESGTGFTDEHGWLYVLIGGMPLEALPKEWRGKLKIPPEQKALSVVSGPLDVLPPK